MKLDAKAFSLTCGIIWGLGVLVVTWWVILFEGATYETTWLGIVYRGYNLSVVGSLIGMVWGFVDGSIGGLIFVWLYNRLARSA